MIAKDAWSLGNEVVPRRYRIVMDVDFKSCKFSGDEQIDVHARKPTDRIVLNSKDLEIGSAEIISKGRKYPASVTAHNKERDEVAFRIQKAFSGDATLHLTFSGINKERLDGFYKSNYEYKGKRHYILTTQFESADARMAFPCFDEPALKAAFTLSLKVDKGLNAISNMPARKVTALGRGKELVEFGETPVMSSYLLYFGIGRFEFRDTACGKVRIRAITVPGRIDQAGLALEYAPMMLKTLEDYFGVPYPLPKLDLIAIPDFAAGAMENWGAITFREAAFLGKEKTSTLLHKQQIALYMAHEMAHQWFGDLVTMEWWDDLWLNESFATLMENKIPDLVFPHWRLRDQVLMGRTAEAISADQLRSTHPISEHTRKPEVGGDEVDIRYGKGSAVLYMIEDYIGEETFRMGLHRYIKEHEYGNATKEDLWNALDAEAETKGIHGLKGIIKEWIERPGYPIVEAVESGSKLKLSQGRFTLSEVDRKAKPWPIPLHYRVGEDGEGWKLMPGRTAEISIAKGNWIKLNYAQTGFYRTHYSGEVLGSLGRAMHEGRIRGKDAWGLTGDFFVFVRSGRLPLGDYTDFVERHCPIRDPILNLGVLSHLMWLYAMTSGESKELVAGLVARRAGAIIKRLTWSRKDDEDIFTIRLRSAAISSLGKIGEKETVAKAREMFRSFAEGRKAIDSDICTAVYAVAALNDAGTYETLKALYKKEQVLEEKRKLLVALGYAGVRNIEAALAFTLSDAVKMQDLYVIPMVISDFPEALPALWEWTKSNWKLLKKKFPPSTLMLNFFVGTFDSLTDEQTYLEFKRFFNAEANRRYDIEAAIERTLEKIDANLAFMRKNGLL